METHGITLQSLTLLCPVWGLGRKPTDSQTVLSGPLRAIQYLARACAQARGSQPQDTEDRAVL